MGDVKVEFRLDRRCAKSLSEQIAEHYRTEILSGRLGEGTILPTRKALVAELGVSKNVVQSAVAKLTTEGLVRARPRIGCEVIRTGRKKISGQLLSVFAEGEGAYAAAIFSETFAAAMNEFGLHCTRVSIPKRVSGKPDYAWLDSELAAKPDIAVIDACRLSAPHVVRSLERHGVPYVLLYARQVRVGPHCLARIPRDSSRAIGDFVSDCLKARIRSVCFVGFGRDSFLDPCAALEEAGLFVERLTIPLKTVFADLNGIQRVARELVCKRLSRGAPCDLLCFGDDYLAFGAIPALLEARIRIPEDLRLVSLVNRGFSPCLSQTLAGFYFDSPAFAHDVAVGVKAWFVSGRFPKNLCFAPTYVRGGTFPI